MPTARDWAPSGDALAALFWLVEAEAAEGRRRPTAASASRLLSAARARSTEAADRYDDAAAPPRLAAALEAVGLGGTAQLALMVEREGSGGVE